MTYDDSEIDEMVRMSELAEAGDEEPVSAGVQTILNDWTLDKEVILLDIIVLYSDDGYVEPPPGCAAASRSDPAACARS